jgi:tRNA/rRNA methyltransferase
MTEILMTPSIILVRPQMGENIGAAARAMANFGLTDLRLVAPRDGWPNPKASDMAGRALNIVEDAALHETSSAAVADFNFVLATTSRERAMHLPVMEPRAAMEQIRQRMARGEKCAILFGPERTGLENEEVILADAVVTIPVAPEYPSLNLAQAVVILGYEWLLSSSFRGGEADGSIDLSAEEGGLPRFARNDEVSAPKQMLEGLFAHLESELDAVNFWRVPQKKEVMWRNIRAGLTRAGLTEQEIATWRGIVKALANE